MGGGDTDLPFMVTTPLRDGGQWAQSSHFDHATRDVEWPDPHDAKLHVYLGSDGVRYIYNSDGERDIAPWSIEGTSTFRSRKSMKADQRDALPPDRVEACTCKG